MQKRKMMPRISLLGHDHTCPAKTGRTPHVGGPIVSGNAALTVNGIPAALVGDTCTCKAGGPDTIVSGTSALTVNGIPAAHVGSSTAHGGVVVQGDAALTVS
jgi:uncharacterized Zn-binding protein involved in type VI secretion